MTTWKRLGRGSVNDVWTDGLQVRRPFSNTAVHELLLELEQCSAQGVPRLLAADGRYEYLSLIEGESLNRPWPDSAGELTVVAQVGRALRGIHDATVSFGSSAEFSWRPDVEAAEVVCHGDLGPWNIVLSERNFSGFIDWDMAHRGSRLWDLATLAVEFGPLRPVDTGRDFDARAVKERLRALCDAYGGVAPERLLEYAPAQLRASAAAIRLQASLGLRLFIPLLESGVPKNLDKDAAFIERELGGLLR